MDERGGERLGVKSWEVNGVFDCRDGPRGRLMFCCDMR